MSVSELQQVPTTTVSELPQVPTKGRSPSTVEQLGNIEIEGQCVLDPSLYFTSLVISVSLCFLCFSSSYTTRKSCGKFLTIFLLLLTASTYVSWVAKPFSDLVLQAQICQLMKAMGLSFQAALSLSCQSDRIVSPKVPARLLTRYT